MLRIHVIGKIHGLALAIIFGIHLSKTHIGGVIFDTKTSILFVSLHVILILPSVSI